MCEILIKTNCPHCQSSKVVRNGKKRNGRQNLLCRSCGKQFLPQYRNRGADPTVRQLAVRLLERNSGVRDTAEALGISRKCVLDNLCRHAGKICIQPAERHYASVQIDEAWSYVGKRKKGKYWLLYAYSPQKDEILAYSCGGRSAKTVRELLSKPEGVEIDEYCTDHWKAFAKVPPPEKHTVGKAHTKNIEGVNTSIRARNRRFVRKTTCFSKKKENHLAALDLMFNYRNRRKAKHHTF
ncbi:IS1 family transposase [Rufibacter immobilis]|uniref:IS1 family transposase n=1 Tax=Rufibacter immobilis TaxID=1348778 RepID=A0A3M9MY71_9BACT|nr:IS1 family transposase [Rufibacter immobilis]RNI30115.1 IS1 family transposase [Rufibacter immobilis]